MKLRDALLDALKTLPGTRTFHIHVLVSAPRKHAYLFPYAVPRPKVDLQDILVLLSEQTAVDSPRILVAGIEASLYHVRQTSSAVLNICKVDTTGHCLAPSPTRRLIEAFMRYYTDPTTCPLPVLSMWIHVFARAQKQYLFPNSSDYSGKRPLTDVKLCAWWKGIYADVASACSSTSTVELSYVLPGLNKLEALQALGASPQAATPATAVSWVYGHPYSQSQIPLPCPAPSEDDEGVPHRNLGHYIPSFDDDPKSRFMDEIAHTNESLEVRSPKRKRRRIDNTNATRHFSDEEVARPEGEMGKVTQDEFWERMSFRQECVAGAVTGFFVLGLRFPPPGTISAFIPIQPGAMDTSNPLNVAQYGQVSSNINRRILASLLTGTEYSNPERAYRSTVTIESAIQALCKGLSADSLPPPSIVKPVSRSEAQLPVLPQSVDSKKALADSDHLQANSNISSPDETNGEEYYNTLLRNSQSCKEGYPNMASGDDTDLDPLFPQSEIYADYVYGKIVLDNHLSLKDKSKFLGSKVLVNKSVEELAGVTLLTARKKKK
jgi:regulator of Ty1 transposition protein 109